MAPCFSVIVRDGCRAACIVLALSLAGVDHSHADAPAALRGVAPAEAVPGVPAPRATLRSVVVEPQAEARQTPPEAPLPEIVPLSAGSLRPTSAPIGQAAVHLEPVTQRPDAKLPATAAAGDGGQPAAQPASPRAERRAAASSPQRASSRPIQPCAVFGPTNCSGGH